MKNSTRDLAVKIRDNQFIPTKELTLLGESIEVSGDNYPVNCLADLKLYGNELENSRYFQSEGYAYQKSTAAGKNLFDYTKLTGTTVTQITGGIELNGYFLISSITPEQFLLMTGLKSGDIIVNTNTFEFVNGSNSGTDPAYWQGAIVFQGKNGVTDFSLRTSEKTSETSYLAYAVPDNFNSTNYGTLIIYGAKNIGTDGQRISRITNIQIEKNPVPTPYAPFVPTSPSLDYPSNIDYRPAGRYQIVTPNGIYETVETVPAGYNLTGYSDKLYLNTNNLYKKPVATLKTEIGRKDNVTLVAAYKGGWSDTHVSFHATPATGKLGGSNKPTKCSHFMDVGISVVAPSGITEGMWFHTDPIYPTNVYIKLARSRLDNTSDTTILSSAQQLMMSKGVYYIYPLATPVYTKINLQKVASSSLPKLPWTPYGNNMLDILELVNDTPTQIKNLKVDYDTSVFSYEKAITYSASIGVNVKVRLKSGTYYIKADTKTEPSLDGRITFNIRGSQDETVLFQYTGLNNAITTSFSVPVEDTYRFRFYLPYSAPVDTRVTISNCTIASTSMTEKFNPIPQASLTDKYRYPRSYKNIEAFNLSIGKVYDTVTEYNITGVQLRKQPTTQANSNFSIVENGVTNYYYGDYIHIKEGRVLFNTCIGTKELDNTSSFSYNGGTSVGGASGYTALLTVNIPNYRSRQVGFCSHFDQVYVTDLTKSTDISGAYWGLSLNLVLNLTLIGATTADTTDIAIQKFKDLAQQLKNLGTPIFVEYQLGTPVETDITETELGLLIKYLSQTQASTVIYTEAELKPYLEANIRIVGT